MGFRMATYQTPDSKKEEFRKYLEKAGVIDALTKVLVRLYEEPERPGNALDFIKTYLGASVGTDVEGLKAEADEAKKKVQDLEKQLEEANAKIAEILMIDRLQTAKGQMTGCCPNRHSESLHFWPRK